MAKVGVERVVIGIVTSSNFPSWGNFCLRKCFLFLIDFNFLFFEINLFSCS